MFRGRKSRKTILGLLVTLQIQQKHDEDVEENGGKKKFKDATESVFTRGNHVKKFLSTFVDKNEFR